MALMQVELVSAERRLWSGEAEMVVARTVDGEIGILPGHAPLLGQLVTGTVRILRPGEDEVVAAVHGGFLSVTDQGVTVLAEVAELASDIDVRRAQDALSRAQGDDDVAAVRRAQSRLRATGQPV